MHKRYKAYKEPNEDMKAESENPNKEADNRTDTD